MKKLLRYSKSTQAKKFFKKHPQLEEDFKGSIISIVKNEKSFSDFDIKHLKGIKNGFRFRKGSQRVTFLMTFDTTTADYKITIIEVQEANNRGDMYKK